MGCRLWRTRSAASRTPTPCSPAVYLTVKPVGEPDAGDRHVRFDERGWETERCLTAQATAPILDSTKCDLAACPPYGRFRGLSVQPVSATPLVVYRLAFGSPRSCADVD